MFALSPFVVCVALREQVNPNVRRMSSGNFQKIVSNNGIPPTNEAARTFDRDPNRRNNDA
jgi:hypothetical protein